MGSYAAMEVVPEDDVVSHRFSPATLSHLTSLNSQEWSSTLESMTIRSPPNVNGNTANVDTLRNRVSASENEIHKASSEEIESARGSNASKEVSNDGFSQGGDKPDVKERWKIIL